MANLRHVAFIVKEPQQLYDFYHHVFGVEQVRTSPTGSIHVIDGLFNLAFLKQVIADSNVENTHRADGQEIDQRPGINHYGFTVEKVDDVLGRLPETAKRGESPQNGRPAEMRVVDPWGNNFDLSSRGFLGREERTLPGVRRVVIQADQPNDTAGFYMSVLDLKEARRERDGSIDLTDGDVSMGIVQEGFVGKAGIQYVGFQVESWDDARRRLREVGVEVPAEAPAGELLLRDPEKNLFAVSARGWGA
jgi:catechol 2,3-dioxygenase-like lactoylglutathione lyase family enzyme